MWVVAVYRPSGTYSKLLSNFFDFIMLLMIGSNKLISFGDFNMIVDTENNSLDNPLDPTGFSQNDSSFNYTLDLVLTTN